uniref:putative group II intron reverse transcriptase/maturase RoaA n=1 Tax=Euglena undulata TaxID=1685799 RepID=UPI0023AB007B|nr:putative group II intron reverse transcriptase/maturase RoaA [Euglena undulata]WCH63430.1 putative group II intron reverse transcriptase/maturase RoaA [Euglena undulata]
MYSKKSNFRLISIYQKYLLKSFSAKLKSIRDSFDNDLSFTSREKFLFVVSLDLLNFPEYFYSIYVPKKNGLAFFFSRPNFFVICFENLFDLSFLPFSEAKTDKLNLGFRPYRDCSDVFVHMKKFLFIKGKISSLFKIEISKNFNYVSKVWILKNVPLKALFFEKWLSINILNKDRLNDDLYLNFRWRLSFSVFNFMLNGLVLKTKIFFTESPQDLNLRMLRSFNNLIFVGFCANDFSLIIKIFEEFFILRGIKIKNVYNVLSIVGVLEFMFWNISLGQKDLTLGNFRIRISEKFIKNYKLKIKLLIKSNYNKSIIKLLNLLNGEISSWISSNIFSDNLKETCFDLDTYVYKALWKYVKRCHPRRPNTWIYSKYWKCFSGLWRFFILDSLSNKIIFLKSHFILKSNFYRVPSFLNAYSKFDKNKLLMSLFEKLDNNFKGNLHLLYRKQNGLCFLCNKPLSINNYKLLDSTNFKYTKVKLLHNLFLVHLYCNIT